MRRVVIPGIVAFALLALLLAAGLVAASDEATMEFTDVREQTLDSHRYSDEIDLTPEQQTVFEAALDELPAPCCSDRSALTCCCECNMARSWWGLSKHLIVDEGYDAEQVRAAVEEWFVFINPDGFSGDACYTGGCFRTFAHNGCGGMNREQVVF